MSGSKKQEHDTSFNSNPIALKYNNYLLNNSSDNINTPQNGNASQLNGVSPSKSYNNTSAHHVRTNSYPRNPAKAKKPSMYNNNVPHPGSASFSDNNSNNNSMVDESSDLVKAPVKRDLVNCEK